MAAHLVFAILIVAVISTSSPWRAFADERYDYRLSYSPLPPLHQRIILFFSHHVSSSPRSWSNNWSSRKLLRHIKAERKYNCLKEPEKQYKDPANSQEPWPRCPMPAFSPPPF
ncbi:hypothetical protein E5676_scaffold1163G00150 [Cucumis melo var. makuwa]|uniref:Uncharacterized protein n=1 Tax=Cucumis melo var. makuwa TaxID=1194695 RepID=A0A5A7UHY5_CUCMM|nr:hypothetical protein E6C27_scaffold43052G00380 [Cucumis melo var. makuwa]TYK22698.1 hypothetical protein E5676_scaffold1163G00150 [Cucumis melo var. makuwa]